MLRRVSPPRTLTGKQYHIRSGNRRYYYTRHPFPPHLLLDRPSCFDGSHRGNANTRSHKTSKSREEKPKRYTHPWFTPACFWYARSCWISIFVLLACPCVEKSVAKTKRACVRGCVCISTAVRSRRTQPPHPPPKNNHAAASLRRSVHDEDNEPDQD